MSEGAKCYCTIYLWEKQVRLIQTASALWGCCVFTAGLRHCAVVAGIPGGVGPAGGVSDTTALELHRDKNTTGRSE